MDINILTDNELKQLQDIILAADNIIITCHKSPDGDAIGASLAWADYLRMKGKQPLIVVPDAFPDFLRWMPGVERIVRYDKHPDEVKTAFDKANVVFCLDYNSTTRVADLQPVLEQTRARRVLIDHHQNPDIDTALSISHPELCATCELLLRIIWQMGDFPVISQHCAVSLYTGMMTDTGGFTYNSTRSEIYFMISQLLTKKVNKDKIFRHVYNVYSDWCIRFRGYVLYQKMNVLADAHAAYFTITKSEMKRFHFIKGDAEGLVNEPLRIKGMRLSISLREDTERDNKIWVSLRSVDHYYCSYLAEKYFHGGGHANAAGGSLECSIDEAVRITREAIQDFKMKYV